MARRLINFFFYSHYGYEAWSYLKDAALCFWSNCLYLTKFRSYSLPALSFPIPYYCSLRLITFNIYCLDIMYTEWTLPAKSNFNLNHNKLINVPFRQPYTSALRQVCPLYAFGWKRMNRALNAVTSKCSANVFLSLLPEKTWNKEIKKFKIYSIVKKDRVKKKN